MDKIQKITKTNLTSKKARQGALKLQIEKIDAELKSIGVADLKFRCGAIKNIETLQNNINISSINDISLIVRLLTYYESLLHVNKNLQKDFTFPKEYVLRDINGQVVYDVIFDLKLKLSLLINGEKIRVLTEARAKLLPFLDEESRFTNALIEIDSLLKTVK